MYANAKSRGELDGDLTDVFACKLSVPQGENLLPRLFSIFVKKTSSSVYEW